jgi:hypothetical protein
VKTKTLCAALLLALVMAAGIACTVNVPIDPVTITPGPVQLLGGFQAVTLSLADNGDFIKYQSKFRGLQQVVISLDASNAGNTEETVKLYASSNSTLNANNVATQATYLTAFTVPANADDVHLSETADATAKAFIEDSLRATPPVLTVYLVTAAATPSNLSFTNVVFEPASAWFSIFRISTDGQTTEVTIRER